MIAHYYDCSHIEHICIFLPMPPHALCCNALMFQGGASFVDHYTPPANFVCRGYTLFTLCVRPSVRNALFP